MKKTRNIGIGGKSFIIDEDAYDRLKAYLQFCWPKYYPKK